MPTRKNGDNLPMTKKPELNLWGEPLEEHQRTTPTLMPLDFEGHEVRMEMIDGIEHWYGADVCRACEIENPSQAYSRLDEDEKLTLIISEGQSGRGGARSNVLLNEAGVFNLILTSRKPEAKRFKRWLTHEVLPALRRTGTYSIGGSPVAREAKRLHCDVITAAHRIKNRDVNKSSHKCIAADGCCPNDFKLWNNASHRGKTGMDAAGLRRALQIRGRRTPHDFSAALVLTMDYHAKTLTLRMIQDSPTPLTQAQKAELLERNQKALADEALVKLGDGYHLGIRDDPRRGKILDVIPRQIG